MPITRPQKVEVNIDQIDNDILGINTKIEALEKEKEFLSNLRKYALAKHLNGSAVTIGKKVRGKRKTKQKTRTKPQVGISEFILNSLKGGRIETKKLIDGWAQETGKEYNKVANSISNALNRLKEDHKVDGLIDPRGRRYGATWTLKNEKAA